MGGWDGTEGALCGPWVGGLVSLPTFCSRSTGYSSLRPDRYRPPLLYFAYKPIAPRGEALGCPAWS